MMTGDFDPDEQNINLFGNAGVDFADIVDLYWQVQSTSSQVSQTDLQTKHNLAICMSNHMSLSCSDDQCDCEGSLTKHEIKEWMIDSGASLHFTGDINNFVEYSPLKTNIHVQSTNSSTKITGSGTVIIQLITGDILQIFPVYYVPGLHIWLLSVGTFLQTGLHCKGTASSIRILNGFLSFLTFYPRNEISSVCVIRSLAAQEVNLFGAMNMIYKVEFEIIHQRLGHPSKDVLQKARKHLKDFPEIKIPPGDHLRPGCTQGKMSNRPFPVTTKRASKPFELIHSNLKSFPIKSYHKDNYVIIFFDDYTPNAWTTSICTKEAATGVTQQFLAFVEKKFSTTVKQWMSDAGEEYKSQAFTKMLKDREIEILQSIPYTHQQNGRAECIIRMLMEKAESM